MSARALFLFLGRRLLALIALLFVVSVAVFALLYVSPGGVEQILLGDAPATPTAVAAVRNEYHLNDPLPQQYGIWLSGAVKLNFGHSIRTGEPVLPMILQHLQLTLVLVIYGFIIAMTLGVLLGILASIKKETPLDRAVVGVSVIGVSSPAFVTSILLLYCFGILIPWFPVFGAGTGFTDELWHLTLPAIALALTVMALVIKLTRAAMITSLEQDYVASARARGLSPWRVVFGYALRNALNPIVTAGGLIFNRILFGTVLVEVAFALPGAGSLLVDSVNFKDIPVVQALGLFTAVIVILVNLLVDVLYLFIDPRLRFERVRV